MTSVMETTTRTADLTTCKIHLNGVVSTKGGIFAASDVKDFYLGMPLKEKRYGKVKTKYTPQVTIDKYKLQDYIIDGWLYFFIYKGMYGITEAGRLANDLLRKRLKELGYYECLHTLGYWRHIWKPISWTLIVDDFGTKYTNKKGIEEFLTIMGKWYTMKTDWQGKSFGGITLE